MRIALLILISLIYCQVNGQRDLKVYVDDYNKDGVADTLKTYFKGGSSYGGKYVGIVEGKTNQYYEITNAACFCQIKHSILIPPELNKIENELFLETIKSEFFPEKRSVPEASLDWILKGSYSDVELDTNSFFVF